MKFLDIIYIYTNSRPSTGMIKIILSQNNNINRLLRKA
jgi:Flp pilus assembly protein TadB